MQILLDPHWPGCGWYFVFLVDVFFFYNNRESTIGDLLKNSISSSLLIPAATPSSQTSICPLASLQMKFN